MPQTEWFNEGTMEVSLTIPDGERSGASKTVHLRFPVDAVKQVLHEREKQLRDAIAGGGTITNVESAADELSHTLDALMVLIGTRDWELRGVDLALPRQVAEEPEPGTRCVTCGHTFLNHRPPDEGGCRIPGCGCHLFMGEKIPTEEEQAEALRREAESGPEDGEELLRTAIRGYVGSFAAEIEMALNQDEEEWEEGRMGRLVDVIADRAQQMSVGSARLEETREQAVQIGMLAAVLFHKADDELLRHES